VTSDGFRLGALCTIDREPRSLSPQAAQILANFGQLAVQIMQAEELRNAESEYETFEVEDDSLYSNDFATGILRESRMQEAIDEVTCLVLAQLDTLDWPILYANEAWTKLMGVRVTPPLRFPGRPHVKREPPVEGVLEGASSLWDYLWLQFDGVDVVLDLWNHIRSDVNSVAGSAQPFAKFASIAPRFANGNSISKVSCRFMPAELPLDMAASAIRAVSQWAGDRGNRIHPDGFERGHLYFVTITRQSLDLTSNLPLELGKITVPIPEEDEEDECCDDEAKITCSRNGTSDSASSIEKTPTMSPFPDVRLLRVLQGGNFCKLYFGTWAGACVGVKAVETSEKVRREWSEIAAAFSTSTAHINVAQQYFCQMIVADVVQESRLWVVREWCDGGSLAKYCNKPRLEGKELMENIDICREIASGLQYMFRRNIFHGSLTPSNVLLKSRSCLKGYVCKVSDFGFARLRQRKRLRTSAFGSTSSSNTASERERAPAVQDYEGIASHMPPEDVVAERQGREPQITAEADIFAFGMIIYQVTAGETPSSWLPQGDLPADFASAADRGRWLRLPGKVPLEYSFLYMRCIAANPQERLDAAEVVEQLVALATKFDPLSNVMEGSQNYRRVGTAPTASRPLKSRVRYDIFSSNPERRSFTPPCPDSSDSRAQRFS
jgi:serine/threonine protein kinase